MADIWLTPHFSRLELKCPCCDRCEIDAAFLAWLEGLRVAWGDPMIVNSAFRCAKHNKAAGGKIASQHVFGRAVDIHVMNSHELFRLASLALQMGASGVGVGKTFLHLDRRPGPAMMWAY